MDEEDRPPFAISSNSAENTPKESSVLPSASLDDKDEDEDDRNGDDHFKVDNPPSEDLAQATDLGSSSQSGSPQWTAAVTTTTTTTTTTSPNRRGSILRRSQARDDHLQRLCLKRHLKDELRQSIAVDPAGTATRLQTTTISQSIVVGSSDGSGVQISTSKVPAEWDHHAVQELRKEVETEFQHTEKHESAKIQELQNIAKDYNETLKGLDEFPLEVRVRNLTLTVLVDAAADAKINTVYNTSCLYPLLAAVRRWYQGESLRRPRLELQEKNLLSNINLILHPGKQYLVLGPPGSGKTTLLRSIAGQWHPPKGHRKEGTISYNGRTLEESDEFFVKNAFAYIDQLDVHAPRLTVEETFEFAYQCSTGGKFIRQMVSPDMDQVLKRANKDHLATRLTLAGLGLTDVKDTYVGDSDIRGVSGGQRRRVTVGEMLMSRAPVLCGDEISTGLDAASTYDMIEVIVYNGRSRKQTGIFSLLQPSPETVSLFDDVIVLAEGHIIYAGTIEHVEDYFAAIGFRSPDFMDVADFLQLVSTGDCSNLYEPDGALKDMYPKPPNSHELARMFVESTLGTSIQEELDAPLSYVWSEEEGSGHGSQISKLVMSQAVRQRYANKFFRSTGLIVDRFLVLWLRDKRVMKAGALKNVLMGVSVGGAFFSTEDELSIQGALFQAGLFIMLGAMQGAFGLLHDRLIFYKHSEANFYSAWPFIFGRALSQIPQTVADTVTFATILYFMVGLADRSDASNFFVYLSILVTFALLMNAQLALFASFASGAQVQVLSSCTLLAMMLFGGFIIPPDAIPRYYYWLYWWNPCAWTYRALIVNEFRSKRWDDPDGILIDAGFTISEGNTFGNVWIRSSFLYMILYWLLCCVLSAVSLGFSKHSDGAAPEPETGDASTDADSSSEKEVIAFKTVALSLHNVGYEVTSSTDNAKLTLLHKVSGIFRPGRMCALMGSSGAGKTTLMDVIALRKRSGTITGEVLLNGWPQNPIEFRRCSGYVEQFDVQSPELTVRETVLFSARLRLDSVIMETDKKKELFVDQVIRDVELSNLANALIGSDEGGGLSFEQKKRLSIAVELAASPSVLFLDEPTSGLDARSAKLVVSTLRKIADGMRTVCATIHQPSSTVFGMFDELLLLKKGGHVVYHGPLGENCSCLVRHFESRGAHPISLGENPANWMIRIISTDTEIDYAKAYVESEAFSHLVAELDAVKEAPSKTDRILFDSEFATTRRKRGELVNQRLQTIYWRSPTYNLARVMVSLIIACILGSVFIFKRNYAMYAEVDIRARLATIFLSFIITGILAITSSLPVMTKIRDMYYRHRDAGMYDSYSMGIALGVAEKPFILCSSVLFCIVFVTSADFGDGWRGLVVFGGMFTFNFAIYSYMGQLFVCLVKSAGTALIMSSVYIGLNNFFAGLILRPQFISSGFYSIPFYINPGHYVYESMVTAIFHRDQRLVLANVGSEFYDFLVDNNINGCTVGNLRCIGTVAQYVDVFFGFQFSHENMARNALILGGVLTFTRVMTWVALKYIRFDAS